jgi:O-antigen/teichoic acid export membrane protein
MSQLNAICEERGELLARDEQTAAPRSSRSLSAHSARGLLYSAVGQFVVAGTALASIRVYTELLTKSEFGFTMLVVGAVALLDGVVVAALSLTLLSICAGIDEPNRQRQVAIGLGLRLFAALALVSAPLALLAIALAVPLRLDTLVVVAPGLAIIYLSEEIAKTSMLGPLIARRDYFRSSLWAGSEAVTTLTVTALSLIVFRADALGFLAGLLSSRLLCTSGFLFVFFRGRYFSCVDFALAAPYVEKALGYGVPLSAMSPIGWVGAYLDRYAIGACAGLAGAGVYSAVAGLVGRPYNVAGAVLTNYFRPLLFQRPRRAARQWLFAAVGVGALGIAAFALLGGAVAWLALAPEYRRGAPAIMVALAIAQAFVIMTHSVDNAVLAAGASGALLRRQIWLVGTALLLVPACALLYGALGAAIGRALAEAVKFAGTLMLSRQMCGVARASEVAVP